MSPEMAQLYLSEMTHQEYQGPQVTFVSDFYSLGVLAYELLNGKPPHGYYDRIQSKEEYLQKVINGPIEIEATDDLADLISQLLSKDPTKRLASWPKLREH